MKPLSLSFLKAQNALLAGILPISLLFSITQSTSIHAQPQNDNIVAVSFRGAELYTEMKASGKVTVYLKKFYDCGHEVKAVDEKVSLFETGTMYVREGIVLAKVSEQKIQDTKYNTPGEPNTGCLTEISYSAELPLGPGKMEYDITWGYNGLKNEIVNLDGSKNNGFALSVHFNDYGDGPNAMPSFNSLPAFIMYANKNASYKIETSDKDNDKVTLYTSAPLSLEPIKPVFNPSNDASLPVMSESSVITTRGPFKEMRSSAGFNWNNPIGGKVFSLDPNTGMFMYEANNKPGKYLAAFTIKDERENKILSEHQCVFVIDVKQ